MSTETPSCNSKKKKLINFFLSFFLIIVFFVNYFLCITFVLDNAISCNVNIKAYVFKMNLDCKNEVIL